VTTIKIYYCRYNAKDGMYYVDKSFPTKKQNKMKKSKPSTKYPEKPRKDKPTQIEILNNSNTCPAPFHYLAYYNIEQPPCSSNRFRFLHCY